MFKNDKALGAQNADETAKGLPELKFSSMITAKDGGEEERQTVPVRNFWGQPTFDDFPTEALEGMIDPRWNTPLSMACYWADGNRSIAEISALVRTEFGSPFPEISEMFKTLECGGLVKLIKDNHSDTDQRIGCDLSSIAVHNKEKLEEKQ